MLVTIDTTVSSQDGQGNIQPPVLMFTDGKPNLVKSPKSIDSKVQIERNYKVRAR